MIHYIMNTKKYKTVPSIRELTVNGEENKQYIKWSKHVDIFCYIYISAI